MRVPCEGCGKFPEDCRCEVRDDFVVRCSALGRKLNNLMYLEPSSRIWVAVMVELLRGIIKVQDDPNDPGGCLKQIIEGLTRNDE